MRLQALLRRWRFGASPVAPLDASTRPGQVAIDGGEVLSAVIQLAQQALDGHRSSTGNVCAAGQLRPL